MDISNNKKLCKKIDKVYQSFESLDKHTIKSGDVEMIFDVPLSVVQTLIGAHLYASIKTDIIDVSDLPDILNMLKSRIIDRVMERLDD